MLPKINQQVLSPARMWITNIISAFNYTISKENNKIIGYFPTMLLFTGWASGTHQTGFHYIQEDFHYPPDGLLFSTGRASATHWTGFCYPLDGLLLPTGRASATHRTRFLPSTRWVSAVILKLGLGLTTRQV